MDARSFPTNAEYIAQALSVEGGHLGIGQGGYTLYFARGSKLSGYDVEAMKAECIAAGLPVVDSRNLPFEVAWKPAVSGPMIAVGEPSSLPPHGPLSYAPFAVVAEVYRAAGADVHNLPLVPSGPPP